ncbi:Penicillinase repressor [Stieleria neptunia]|uniref:Penicillinase repressor n=1 Tax=Stieleria neptunia TaxID=2527979 RepID=A0A518HTS5_9BACT|nr:BlaI/MecI/CopY family transcriptional regulator [Stieleria neptunia]QDV44259.1 Penicillinase repressor [Stieleria neptunia]
MPRPANSTPTDVELQILRALWEYGPCGVGPIHECLHRVKGTNYSTTVKMLSVMLGKGLVKRDESKRPHIYRAVWTRERTGKSLLRDLAKKVYNGSVSSLVMQALSSSKASDEDIERIREILEEMENRDDG